VPRMDLQHKPSTAIRPLTSQGFRSRVVWATPPPSKCGEPPMGRGHTPGPSVEASLLSTSGSIGGAYLRFHDSQSGPDLSPGES